MTSAASRQLLDDLSYARFKAITDRTTVYMVFVSPDILQSAKSWPPARRRALEIPKFAKLQFTSYALYAKRSLGDQPGPGTRRYLREWQSLPEGTFILTNKFDKASQANNFKKPAITRTLQYERIPFPNLNGQEIELPCIAFDYQGRLTQSEDIVLPIAKGSIVFPQEQKADSLDAPEVIETPKGNFTNNPAIRIDWLTGRARTIKPENPEEYEKLTRL
jgi:hypothetical protein